MFGGRNSTNCGCSRTFGGANPPGTSCVLAPPPPPPPPRPPARRPVHLLRANIPTCDPRVKQGTWIRRNYELSLPLLSYHFFPRVLTTPVN